MGLQSILGSKRDKSNTGYEDKQLHIHDVNKTL
jgi:hypothetical protein